MSVSPVTPLAPTGVFNLFAVAFALPVAVVVAVAVVLNWGR